MFNVRQARASQGRHAGTPSHDDLVRRNFTAAAPNGVWLADLPEHRTDEGKLYVCAIKDVFSNRIVGWSIDSGMKARLVVAAIELAVARRGGDVAGCILHSGRLNSPCDNPAPVTVSGSQAIPESEIKNGTTSFAVETKAPEVDIAGAPDCPNPQWTERIEDLSFTSATITIEQPPGTVVLTITCTLASPTTDGAVPGGNVSCTQS